MLAISRASFRSITRSPSAVVFTLAFPLIFILVFGFISGGNLSIDVAVDKNCNRNDSLYIRLKNDSSVINLIEDKTDVEIQKALEKGSIDAYINIQHFNNPMPPYLSITLKTSAASIEKGRIFKSIINGIVDKINLSQLRAEPIAKLEQSVVTGREYKRIDFVLPGQLGFSILSTGVFGVAFVFFNLRQTLVIKRFFATPIQKPYIIVGEAIARIVFALLGAAFIITIGRFAFGFTLVNGLVTFLNMLVLSAIGLIVFMGFGFIVSGVAKNESTIPPFANMITLPQFLLSGTFFGIEAFPKWLQPICRVLPLTFLNDAMRKVAFEGLSLIEVAPQIGALALWGVLVYVVASRVFKWE
ncbi:MAG: ABC transporter permease [Bacteroidia bacterium]